MAYAQEEKALDLPHRLVLEGRGKLAITGITEIESFDENTVVLYTTRGTLVIHGRQLHLSALSVDGGQASVDGTIDSMVYEDDAHTGGRFLSRLFG